MNRQIDILDLKHQQHYLEHSNAFENNLYDQIQKVEFTNVQNIFQQKLKKGVQSIKSSNNMLVFADKKKHKPL